jgi:hypothetical protein
LITSVEALEKVDFSGPGPKLLDIRVDPEVNVRDAL